MLPGWFAFAENNKQKLAMKRKQVFAQYTCTSLHLKNRDKPLASIAVHSFFKIPLCKLPIFRRQSVNFFSQFEGTDERLT